jgi:hypothetical protein
MINDLVQFYKGCILKSLVHIATTFYDSIDTLTSLCSCVSMCEYRPHVCMTNFMLLGLESFDDFFVSQHDHTCSRMHQVVH